MPVGDTISLNACPTWHARATYAMFLGFRDTWGALVTGGDRPNSTDSAEIRDEWRVADGSGSMIATTIIPANVIIPDYYLSVRRGAVCRFGGGTDCYRNESPTTRANKQMNNRETARDFTAASSR